MTGKTIEELELGMAAEVAKRYDEWDVYTFAALTGDLNPAHTDQAFAERTVFKEKIAHGMLTASLISATLGMKLPGAGSIYLAQDLKFLRPVRIGDTVTARVAVIELIREKNLARLQTTCTNQRSERLLEGTALVMPPKVKLPTAVSDVPGAPEEGRPRRVAGPRPRKQGWLVGQRMTPNPVTISPAATLGEARALLARHGIRHLPVLEGEQLVGIVTDSDIRQASFPGAAGSEAPESEALLNLIKVGEVMTRNVTTIGPDASIGQAGKLLVSRKVGGLPVVKDGRLMGIVTAIDALDALVEITGS